VVNGGTVFGLSHKGRGRFVALDAGTGKTLWATTGREGDNAALLTAGDKLFALTTDGEFIVAKADAAAFKPLRRYTVAKSATWAHPVLAGSRLLVKDEDALTSWRIQ
jgi:outer membrane protein assembly factor BamB